MNFQPELAAKVMAGEKTVTRRQMSANPRSPWWEGGCSLKVGRDYAVCPGRAKRAIGRVIVSKVCRVRLGDMTVEEARAEGFRDRTDFIAGWCKINGSWSHDEVVWRIEFSPLP